MNDYWREHRDYVQNAKRHQRDCDKCGRPFWKKQLKDGRCKDCRDPQEGR